MKGIVKKLCDIDGIAIPAEMLEVHVDDKQVEQVIERLSLRYAKECPAETAQNGDLVRCHAEAGDGRPILLYPGMAKPGGFDEDVGLGGSNFSGGQAQCISIARAMLRDADYLLLDEATSNLDVVSEAAVTEAMDHLMEGRTTIMIAHNFAATRNADYIIVMKDGTVEAAGTPEELQETNEYYRMFSKTL